MTKYHVLMVPLFDWRSCPRTEQQLKSLVAVIGRLFSFDLDNPQFRQLNDWCLLRIAQKYIPGHIVVDATELARCSSRDLIESLKIDKVFLSNYAIEVSSFTSDILRIWDSYKSDELVNVLSHALHPGVLNPGIMKDGKPSPIGVIAMIAHLDVTVTEDILEAEKIANSVKAKKICDGFHVIDKDHLEYDTAFNFKHKPWGSLSIPNGLITSSSLNDLQNNALQQHVALVYSFGILYGLVESIRYVIANLEYTSWFLEDILRHFEMSFYRIQRYLSNLEEPMYKLISELKTILVPYARLADHEVYEIMQGSFGELFPDIDFPFTVIADERWQQQYKYNIKPIRKDLIMKLMLLHKYSGKFLEELIQTTDRWKDLQRSRVQHRRLLLAIAAIIVTLILAVCSRI